jgi:hypothetical protein
VKYGPGPRNGFLNGWLEWLRKLPCSPIQARA